MERRISCKVHAQSNDARGASISRPGQFHVSAWHDLLCFWATSVTVTSEEVAKSISYKSKWFPITVNQCLKINAHFISRHTQKCDAWAHAHTQGERIYINPYLIFLNVTWREQARTASTHSLGKEAASCIKQFWNSSHRISIPKSQESEWLHQDLS